MKTTIRPATREDVPELKDVIDSTGLFPSALLDEMMSGYFSGNGTDHWFVCEVGRPVAVCYFAPERLTSGTYNLYLIAVKADLQGTGIGRSLMAHVEAELRNGGHRILIVETSGLPVFQQTRDFYRKIGYTHEATIREFYNPGEDKIVFWKQL